MTTIATHELIHRQGLFALLLAPLAALSLHIFRFPFWMMLFVVLIFLWRFQIYRGVWSFPSKMMRFALVLIAIAVVIMSYRQWYSLEPMVFLLMMAFLLKVLEVREQRDAIILIFVAYFVAASAFLFEQGIIISIFGVLVVALLTASLFILHANQTLFLSKRTLKQVALLIGQAIPLMLLMFFIFPRIGALWAVPLQSESAMTGVSDSMAPGDFSQLTQSREVAFRIRFDNNQPPLPAQRYWRGLALNEFDGRRWQRSIAQRFNERLLTDRYQPMATETLRYEVTMEPTNQNWLYGIPLATVNEISLSNNLLQRNVYNELVLQDPIAQRLRYQVTSSLAYRVEESSELLRQALLLPRDFNPATLQQARQWWQLAGSVEAYIECVLRFYRDNFFYTLSPPALGEHTADEFLFETQRGFCEHFASSFVILMRAVGIPARVVVGYQGGEWNTGDNYLIVRQQEAHAWAEVWLNKQGWVRVDPTAAVAPDRIEANLTASLSPQDQLLMDRGILPTVKWLSELGLRWDSLNYRWQRWVLQYDEQKQNDWLKELLGQVTPIRVAMLLMIPAGLSLLVMALLLTRRAHKIESKEVKLYKQLQQKLKRKGIEPQAGETISQLCNRAGESLPESRAILKRIHHQFEALLYSGLSGRQPQRYQSIKALLKKI